MNKEKILIVDDESEIRELIQLYLSYEGFEVIEAADGEKAYYLTKKENPDLIILDVLLPAQDGFEVCNKLRHITDVPILFLSCKSEDTDKIIGLSVGGDDYITKPFSPKELIARIKANLRQARRLTHKVSERQLLSYSGLEINLTSHAVSVNNSSIELTAKEFEILTFLARHPNRVFYTSQIFQQVWGTSNFENDIRTVMVHISNLRKKIEPNPNQPKYIITVRGIGYKFNNPSSCSSS